jgi:hypothetical protein
MAARDLVGSRRLESGLRCPIGTGFERSLVNCCYRTRWCRWYSSLPSYAWIARWQVLHV